MPGLPVQAFRLKNFKAVRDSGLVRFNPFTVFIGNNGVGKSSLLEGLETFRAVVTDGLDEALRPWLGLDHVLHKGTRHSSRLSRSGRLVTENPIEFIVDGWLGDQKAHAEMRLGSRDGSPDHVWIEHERYSERNGPKHTRDGNDVAPILPTQVARIEDGESILRQLRRVARHLEGWQFALLDPDEMGRPRPTRRTRGKVRLSRDGSNVAEYLLDIRDNRGAEGVPAFAGIVEALAFVLPYAEDLQPKITREIERAAYLQLSEVGIKAKLPGWLLSTGTLRVLALLALLRDPEPPPLIVIEEIENGLDPRTIHLIVSVIRDFVAGGERQVIATSHSPYLLDLLDLDDLILAERQEGQVTFTRPADHEGMAAWTDRFDPGRLYTMGRLHGRNK